MVAALFTSEPPDRFGPPSVLSNAVRYKDTSRGANGQSRGHRKRHHRIRKTRRMTPLEEPEEEEDDTRKIGQKNVDADHHIGSPLSDIEAPEFFSLPVLQLQWGLLLG